VRKGVSRQNQPVGRRFGKEKGDGKNHQKIQLNGRNDWGPGFERHKDDKEGRSNLGSVAPRERTNMGN